MGSTAADPDPDRRTVLKTCGLCGQRPDRHTRSCFYHSADRAPEQAKAPKDSRKWSPVEQYISEALQAKPTSIEDLFLESAVPNVRCVFPREAVRVAVLRLEALGVLYREAGLCYWQGRKQQTLDIPN